MLGWDNKRWMLRCKPICTHLYILVPYETVGHLTSSGLRSRTIVAISWSERAVHTLVCTTSVRDLPVTSSPSDDLDLCGNARLSLKTMYQCTNPTPKYKHLVPSFWARKGHLLGWPHTKAITNTTKTCSNSFMPINDIFRNLGVRLQKSRQKQQCVMTRYFVQWKTTNGRGYEHVGSPLNTKTSHRCRRTEMDENW